jgi:flagellar hook protein FlgE
LPTTLRTASTTGYKRASTEFSSLILPSSAGSYNSGAVQTERPLCHHHAGPLEFTTSNTDLALDGDGFFIVNDSNGLPFLTRAGSFVPDGDGNLVNAAGFTLMGYDYTGGTPAPVVNGLTAWSRSTNPRQPDRDAIDHGMFSRKP